MQASKRFLTAIVFVLSFGIAFSGIAFGQDGNMKDLNDYLCKDVMRLSGSDRDVAIGVFHAFILGKKGTTKFDVPKLSDATDEFVERCLANPDDKALEVMEKLTK